MYKEAIISIITVVVIILLNSITCKYTEDSVSELAGQLQELRGEVSEESIKNEEVHNKVRYIYDVWSQRYNVLSFYIEHNELEKIEKSLVLLSSAVDTEEYADAIRELDESVSDLRHVQDHNSFDLKNIF